MNHWFGFLNVLGSAVLVGFGLFVWRVEPGNRRNQAFCLFALAFSLSTALDNLDGLLGLTGQPLSTVVLLRGLFYGLGGAGAVWFALATVEAERRRLAWAAAPAALLLTTVAILQATTGLPDPFGSGSGVGPVVGVAEALGFVLLLGGAVSGVLLFASDFRQPAREIDRRREQAYLSAALLLYPVFYLTRIGANVPTPSTLREPGIPFGDALLSASFFGVALVVLAAWLRNTRIPEGSALARNVTLVAAGTGLVGLAVSVGDPVAGDYGVPFLIRTGTVAILGYAILRDQLLGIDAKVEYGLSKTTVAGIFVAVFFIVSEGAQVLFADVAGDNELLGVLAAGLLVFAISPIQRMADRFAAKAVPGGAEAGAGVEERYRRAVRLALADGEIARAEEAELAARAEELGLGPTRALELRREVEADQLDDPQH